MMSRSQRVTRQRRRRLLRTITVALVAIVVVIVVLVWRGSATSTDAPVGHDPTSAVPSPTPTSNETPAPDEPQDAGACSVTLSAEGITDQTTTHENGALFSPLPQPVRDDVVFAGWYQTELAAEGLDRSQRVGLATRVACEDGALTLHGAWLSSDEVTDAAVGVPVLMYHQFTDQPEGIDDPLRLNWAYAGDVDDHMRYLAENDFYLPSWEELDAFIDGALYLPPESVIVTDDDAHASWFDLAVPIVNRYEILSTSFVITKWRDEPTPSPYVLQRSHTHDMHEAGANGEGRMVNWSPEEIAADLETSAAILGAKEVVAYPFGHYDERTKEGMRLAGFELGLTIEPGRVYAGADKLALPRVRIDYGMDVDALAALVG
ncbi:polysaccharide deacetylase family protein [Microbacterium amylolyticum]|uniref:NodB homology domain-containing protein n=1 Tax=Microbacterium amylolyticum TaxID=936337 RepID=A0ABS4ZFL7_9MICO|nr:polysaccharide deacetylase family protein [Microbacterium amylolyticum]MBP2435828.1 hypothetical protein [Microbacterium amylolyticum]